MLACHADHETQHAMTGSGPGGSAYISGQIGTAGPNKKTSISRSKSKTLEQSRTEWNQNNRNKDRKRCDIITFSWVNMVTLTQLFLA
jgi:hypothetical protein